MKVYSVKELAAELGTDGKTLRRWLRDHSGLEQPGSGQPWKITTSQAPKVRSGFEKHINRPKNVSKSSSTGAPLIDDAPGLTHEQARDPQLVRKITEERVDRLEAALRATGKHISQMRDREGWAPRVKADANA
jgi:hypothetical protein